ncbi:MAG: hypothetical protein LBQ79_07785 [Deltaproteobacteria bacterium]|jgi:hypothetical protein|nr:hypothetical protein [Deltaproteobacteria bacterium]
MEPDPPVGRDPDDRDPMEEFLREAFPAPDVWDGLQVTGFRTRDFIQARPLKKESRHVRRLVVMAKALAGELAPWSPHWSMRCPDGKPLAHLAARLGCLPDRFDRWEIADARGRTAAHAAAAAGTLPPNLDVWELADRTGWTVRDEDFIGRNRKRRRKK